MECILFSAARVCSSLRTDVLYTVEALGWCSIAMSNIVHMCTTAHGTARGCFLFFFFFLHNRLVWIIEGPDNRESTVQYIIRICGLYV